VRMARPYYLCSQCHVGHQVAIFVGIGEGTARPGRECPCGKGWLAAPANRPRCRADSRDT
jgi:hypothetical protein